MAKRGRSRLVMPIYAARLDFDMASLLDLLYRCLEPVGTKSVVYAWSPG
jgi:hypothetical protein